MTSWREIERFRKDAARFRGLAASLLAHTPQDVLTEWELAFLGEIGTRSVNTIEFTNRQSEKLLEIRDNVQKSDVVGRGFNVGKLIAACYLARLDLSEDDEGWIVALWDEGASGVRRRDAGRLLRCARQLGIIDDDGAA